MSDDSGDISNSPPIRETDSAGASPGLHKPAPAAEGMPASTGGNGVHKSDAESAAATTHAAETGSAPQTEGMESEPSSAMKLSNTEPIEDHASSQSKPSPRSEQTSSSTNAHSNGLGDSHTGRDEQLSCSFSAARAPPTGMDASADETSSASVGVDVARVEERDPPSPQSIEVDHASAAVSDTMEDQSVDEATDNDHGAMPLSSLEAAPVENVDTPELLKEHRLGSDGHRAPDGATFATATGADSNRVTMSSIDVLSADSSSTPSVEADGEAGRLSVDSSAAMSAKFESNEENIDTSADAAPAPERTPEYMPLRHHHGRGRPEATSPTLLRIPQQAPRPIRAVSPSPIEPPVTRSNCGYRKLLLADGDYSATVLVPQCTLGDSEKLEEECAVQLGPPTPAEERLAQSTMPPVRQLHPALHTKLSRITGTTLLQPYSSDMSPARDRTASSESERWHVFILEASEGSIEYDRSTRRLSTRSSAFRTPEPTRDRGAAAALTPSSRRKRSLSAVAETGVHVSASKRSAPSPGATASGTSPLRRSTRIRGASRAPSEVSESPEHTQSTSNSGPRRMSRGTKTSESGAGAGALVREDVKNEEARPETAASTQDSTGGLPKVSSSSPPVAESRPRKRKLESPTDVDQEDRGANDSERQHTEPPKRGFGWSLRRWFGR